MNNCGILALLGGNMINIAICDDDYYFIERFQHQLLEILDRNSLLLVSLGIVTEMIAGFLISFLNDISIELIQKTHSYYVVGAIISKLLLILLFRIIIRIWKRKSEQFPLKQ